MLLIVCACVYIYRERVVGAFVSDWLVFRKLREKRCVPLYLAWIIVV